MNATRQPMTTFVMAEIAKRLMSSEHVCVQANSVVITHSFNDEGQFQAIKFGRSGKVIDGLWSPDRDWEYPSDIMEGEPGTFVANA